MKHDYSKLRLLIISKFGSVRDFADSIGIPEQVVSAKLNNKRAITRRDIELWSDVLGITIDLIGEYFFTLEVKKVERGEI